MIPSKPETKLPKPVRQSVPLTTGPTLQFKHELKDSFDITEGDGVYFPKRKIHDSELIQTKKESLEIITIAENAGYNISNPLL